MSVLTVRTKHKLVRLCDVIITFEPRVTQRKLSDGQDTIADIEDSFKN